MYALILTIVAGGYSAPAMTSVSGFESLKTCLEAGNLWLQKTTVYNGDSKAAVCVKIQ